MLGRSTVPSHRPRHGPTAGPCCAWSGTKSRAVGRAIGHRALWPAIVEGRRRLWGCRWVDRDSYLQLLGTAVSVQFKPLNEKIEQLLNEEGISVYVLFGECSKEYNFYFYISIDNNKTSCILSNYIKGYIRSIIEREKNPNYTLTVFA